MASAAGEFTEAHKIQWGAGESAPARRMRRACQDIGRVIDPAEVLVKTGAYLSQKTLSQKISERTMTRRRSRLEIDRAHYPKVFQHLPDERARSPAHVWPQPLPGGGLPCAPLRAGYLRPRGRPLRTRQKRGKAVRASPAGRQWSPVGRVLHRGGNRPYALPQQGLYRNRETLPQA